MRTSGSHISRVTLRVVSVAGLSTAAVSPHPTLSATAAGVGLALFAWSLWGGGPTQDSNAFRWAGVSVVLILLLRLTMSAGPLTEIERTVRPFWIGALILASAIAVVAGHRHPLRVVSIGIAFSSVLVLTGAMTVAEWRSDLGFDVYHMHRGAGEALFAGENPYTDAVRVENGSPYAPPGSVIEGYPYPPVVLATYAVAAEPADSRLVTSVSWLVVLSWMTWLAVGSGASSDTAYAMFLLLAGLAVWPVVWFASWTEPLTVVLLLLAALFWKSRPIAAAFMLGLAIASKQYMVFLAPLLLFHKDGSKRLRLSVALSVASATLLLGLLPDPTAFVSATFTNLADIGFRPDTQSLPGLLAANGLDMRLSAVAWISIGLAGAALIAQGSGSASDFVGRVGLVLGFAFFVGQAFANYWYLVLALLAIASVLDARSAEEDSHAGRRRQGVLRQSRAQDV